MVRGTKVYLFVCGISGCRFFFVLSGFLIGNIIIKKSARFDLKDFLKRRWLRTLPNYYLFLILFVLIEGRMDWRNVFFLQNLLSADLPVMAISWSLSIEEWFYLLVPVCILVARKIVGDMKQLIIATCLIFVFGGLIVRCIVFLCEPGGDWGMVFRMSVIASLDAIAIGFLLCVFKV